MEPKVLNIRSIKGSWPKNTVRVDRRTEWGNPFIMRNKSDKERDRVCDAFEEIYPPTPARPVLVVRLEESPESLTTCYQGRSGSCWTEE